MFWGWNFLNKLNRGSDVAFVITFLCFSMLFSSASLAVLLMEYEQVLDLTASQERAIRPTAVSCDQLTGDICVTDAQYSNFHIFNKHGVEVFKTGGISGLSYPLDASLTSSGDFIFIGKDEHGVTTIRRLNFMGEPVEFTPEIPIEDWSPLHLVNTRDGNIITLDSYHGILSKHDSNTGALLWLTEFSNDESRELQLGRPAETPDGRIYVPSGMLHNVMIFSEDGKQLETIGEFGTGPGKMVFPVGVAIGPEESILVLDRMRHKVLMFDKDHNLLGDFGSMGAGLGQFYHPSAIAASDNGKVYVAQGYDSRVQVFNLRNTKVE